MPELTAPRRTLFVRPSSVRRFVEELNHATGTLVDGQRGEPGTAVRLAIRVAARRGLVEVDARIVARGSGLRAGIFVQAEPWERRTVAELARMVSELTEDEARGPRGFTVDAALMARLCRGERVIARLNRPVRLGEAVTVRRFESEQDERDVRARIVGLIDRGGEPSAVIQLAFLTGTRRGPQRRHRVGRTPRERPVGEARPLRIAAGANHGTF